MFPPTKLGAVMSSRSADAVLNESFLEVRAKLLEIAATLDRIDRSVAQGPPLNGESLQRRQRLSQALELLLEDAPGRAENVQRLFSREYEPDWRATMSL